MQQETCQHCGRTITIKEPAFLVNEMIVCLQCHDELEPTCPHCQGRLKRRPKARTKCPHCANYVFVRLNPEPFESTIVTKEQADQINAAMRFHRSIDELRRYGITQEDVGATKEALRARFGCLPSNGDLLWALSIVALKRQTNAIDIVSVYSWQADFLHGEGRDPLPARQGWAKVEIMGYKASGVVAGIRVSAAPGCCEACQAQDGTVYGLEEALRVLPVPCRQCTGKLDPDDKYAWCRCDMVAVLKSEEQE